MNEVELYDRTKDVWLGKFPESEQVIHDAKQRQQMDLMQGHYVWIIYKNKREPSGGMTA